MVNPHHCSYIFLQHTSRRFQTRQLAMSSLFSQWGEICTGYEHRRKHQRYKTWRKRARERLKDKEVAREEEEIEHETSWLLKNKQERQWIAAPLHTDTWWMGLLPKKLVLGEQGKCVWSSHCVYVCDPSGPLLEWPHWRGCWDPVSSHPPQNKTYSSVPKTALRVSCQT